MSRWEISVYSDTRERVFYALCDAYSLAATLEVAAKMLGRLRFHAASGPAALELRPIL